MTQTQTEPRLPPVLTSPYTGLSEPEQARLNATISRTDWELLRSVCPLQGTFNCIIGTIVKHICNELTKRQVTTYNPDAVLSILHECAKSGVPECANSGVAGHSGPSDVVSGPTGIPPTHPRNESQSTDLRGTTAAGGVRPGRTVRRGQGKP